MAELRGGACSMPQCSLISVPVPLSPARCSNLLERFLDLEKSGIRLQRRYKNQAEKRIRTRIPAVIAGTGASTSESGEESGTRKFPGTFKLRSKGDTVVFVAGATGKVGSRTVKELLKLGFRVRAGVRNIEKAKTVLEDAITSANEKSPPLLKVLSFLGFKQPDQLEFVDCDLEKPEEIELALGNAGVVVCAIGASENNVLDITGPYRIDYQATNNLITAAKESNVKHFILLTSLGTTKFGWPASILNLFWGVLLWKAKAEKALVDSGLVYTIVRPGGMERPTDAFKETHNLILGPKDAFSGGQISRLQVAELLACIASNLDLAENKILEAIAETTAPRRPIIELLEEIPSDTKAEQEKKEEKKKEKGTFQLKKKRGEAESVVKPVEEEQKTQPAEDDRKAKALLRQQAAEEEAKQRQEAEEEEKQRQKAEEEAKQQQKADAEAKKKAAEAEKTRELRAKIARELEALKKQEGAAVAEAEKLQKRRAELAEKAQAASSAAAKAEALAKALLGAAKQGKVITEEEKKKIVSTVEKPPSKEVIKSTATKAEEKRQPEKKFKDSTPKPKPETISNKQVKAKAAPVEEKPPAKAPVPAPSPAPKAPEKPATETKLDQVQAEKKTKLDQVQAEKKTIDEKVEKPSPPTIEPVKAAAPAVNENKTKTKTEEPKGEGIKAEKQKAEKKPEVKPVEVAASIEKETKKETTEVKEEKQEKVEEPKPVEAPVAAAAKKIEEEAKKTSKPFRWFWEPPKADAVQEKIESFTEEQVKPPARPLSPYSRYPDFIPPTSPKPPSSVKAEEDVAEASPASSKIKPVEAPAEAEKKTEQSKPFRWFWEPPEAGPAEEKIDTFPSQGEKPAPEEKKPSAEQKTPPVEETKPAAEEKKPALEPLSPYNRYPDLKPPASPKPPSTPSSEKPKQEEVVSKPITQSEPDPKPVKPSKTKQEVDSTLYAKAVKEREQAALERARAAVGWPWNKAPSVKKPKIIRDDVKQEIKKDDIKPIKVDNVKPDKDFKSFTTTKPLSPYWRYPDLKPPTAPRPPKVVFNEPEPSEASPPKGGSELQPAKDEIDGASVSEQIKKLEVKENKPSSIVPEAPIQISSEALAPKPVAQEETPSSESESQEKDDPKERALEALGKAKVANKFVWPWQETKVETTSSAPVASSTKPATPITVSRPLSPYARYEDLKPPSSPSPSPPGTTTSTSKTTETTSKKPSRPAGTDSTPDVDEASLEAQARADAALEKARASIKWPWK